MANAVIYVRVSTEEQTQNYSLESQEKECRAYASRNSLIVTKLFREEGVSAKTVSGRPELKTLLTYCTSKKNCISTVLVYKFDRWSRNAAEGGTIVAMLAKYGVDVKSVTEPTENNAMGKVIVNLMLTLAQFDNDVKSERVKSGMLAAIEAGRWPWGAPIGYKHIVVDGKKKLVFLEEYREILTTLFENASKNISTKIELVDQINKLGFAKLWGKPATEKTIDKIIKKKFYYGMLEAKTWKLESKGIHEAIIDEETWIKANMALYKQAKNYIRSRNRNDFPLKGFVRCGGCLHPLRGSFNRGNGGLYANYHCTHKGCEAPIRIRKERLETQFLETVKLFQLSKNQQEKMNKVLTKRWEDEICEHEQREVEIRQQIEEISNKKLAVVESNNKHIIDDDEASEMLERLNIEKMGYYLDLSENEIDKSSAQAVANFTASFLSNVGMLWQKLDVNEKIKLQYAIFPKGVVFMDGDFGTNEISPSFRLIQQFAEEKNPLVIPAGVEPAIFWMRTKCPRPLDDGTMSEPVYCTKLVRQFDFSGSKV